MIGAAEQVAALRKKIGEFLFGENAAASVWQEWSCRTSGDRRRVPEVTLHDQYTDQAIDPRVIGRFNSIIGNTAVVSGGVLLAAKKGPVLQTPTPGRAQT